MRWAVGATITAQGFGYFPDQDGLRWSALVGASMILTGACLLLGLITPLFALLACLQPIGMTLSWFPAPRWNLFEPLLPAVLVTVVAAAVLFLGPGALSVDARLFGRREIIIPKPARPPKPEN